MRDVEVKKTGDYVTISVGVVDQNGNYEVLKVTPAEAAILMMKIKEAI